jgi:polar amino acid transport system substrate-binding protein
MRRAVLTALTAMSAASLVLAACGSDSNDSSSTEAATAAPGGTEAGTATTAVADATACAKGKTLTDGTLTVATGNPAFSPWVIDDKPESGQGFESAVAYAVAEKMGFDQAHVKWVRTGFDEAIQPGKKNFDFNIQQYTITPEREKTVSFSEPYYTTNQALVTFANSKYATAKTIADLKSAKLGAATGTTSLAFINDVIKPSSEASVYDTNEDAKAALEANQIDGIVVDLPTSFGIAYGDLKDGTVAGQFTREEGEKGDELGMLFDLHNPLVACVNAALDQLKAGGTLKQLEDKWLAGSTGAPVIAR